MTEVEIVNCSCGHEFEAFHNDLGTYMCPECCRDDQTTRTKPLDKAMKILSQHFDLPEEAT